MNDSTMYQLNRQLGFTLIELSIVLVIIGLIVGGVLAGQELISAAATRAQLAQIEKYNTAVRTFQGKYGAFPGDLTTSAASQFGFYRTGCDGSVGQGDGNGYVDGYYGGQYIIEYGEATLFWADLSQAGLIEGLFPSAGSYSAGICGGFTTALSLTPGANYIGNFFPSAKIGQGNFIYVYDGSHPGDSTVGGDNWFGIAAVNSVLANGGTTANTTLSVMQAYRMDKKIDDGIPNSGRVRATYLNSWWVGYSTAAGSDSATTCWNWTSMTYSTNYNQGNGVNCALSFAFQ